MKTEDPIRKLLNKRINKPKPIINVSYKEAFDQEEFRDFMIKLYNLVKDDYYVITCPSDCINVINGDVFDLDEMSARELLEKLQEKYSEEKR